MYPPDLPGAASSIIALERRLEYLQDKVDRRFGSMGALQFDRAELRALREAIAALQYCRRVTAPEHRA